MGRDAPDSAEAVSSQLRSVTPHRLLRHSLVLTIATAVVHGTNWLYHVVMSRALGPVSYGGLSALLGLLVIMTVPVNTIQMGLSVFVARARANRQERDLSGVISRTLRIFLLVGVASVGGRLLEAAATYTVAINNFMLGGGDGYGMLSAEGRSTHRRHGGPGDGDRRAAGDPAAQTIAANVEGQIQVVQ